MTYYLHCNGMCVLVSPNIEQIEKTQANLEAEGFECLVFEEPNPQEID